METVTIDEKKFEELVERAVRKHLQSSLQDMEEIRRSPAASIIRIEGRLDAIEARLDRDMVTRAQFHEAMGNVNTRIAKLEATTEG